MKIGILTYQNAHNYGAVIQLTALKFYLEKIGYDVEVINYINKEIDKNYNRLPKYHFVSKNLKSTILSIIRLPLFWIKFIYSKSSSISRYDKFENYLKQLNCTKEVFDIHELDLDKYDFIICGSDQIWNPVLTSTLDKVYFANFNTKATKISYAASMGLKVLPRLEENKFKEFINCFDYISVREESLKEYASKFTNKKIEVVLDPTLLLDAKDYDKYIIKPNISNYILVYTLSEDKNLLLMAEELAKKNNLQIIELRSNRKITHLKYTQIADAGPKEFLGLIKYADKVVTNSFHGTIFSVLFEKDIYILKSHWAQSRLETLVKMLGIEGRYIFNLNEAKDINLKTAKKNIIKEREKSISFLNKALSRKEKVKVSNKCSSCSACYNICPHNAITMTVDEKGFKYPIIDKDKCVNCNLCRKICPIIGDFKFNKEIDKIKGIKANDNIRKKSQSGGAGYELANAFINDGGKVVGVVLDDNLKAIHKIIDKNELSKLQGSKYVQSDLGDIFKEVKMLLKNNKVLFFGTPCQVAGIRKYTNYSKNLYTVDIICHGVMSPMIYNDYLIYLEKKYKKEIKTFDFRDKRYGWNTAFETIYFKNGKEKTTNKCINIFFKENSLRPYCYQCKYSTNKRTGDITIGDLWGIDKEDPSYLDGLGISFLTINNPNGEYLYNLIKDKVTSKEYKKNNLMQHNLLHPTKPQEDDYFFHDYFNMKFEDLIKKYDKTTLNDIIIINKRKLKRNVKKILKKK